MSVSLPKSNPFDSISVDSQPTLSNQAASQSSPNHPFFPLGIYGTLNSTEVWESWNNWFNTIAIGFDEPSSFKLNFENILQACDVLGMNVLFETSYFLRYEALTDLLDLILTVADHPSIYAWYVVDEPGISFEGGANSSHIDGDMIREAVEIINQIDDRPTFVQFSLEAQNESFLDRFAEVPNFVDIISVDPYPNMPYTNHNVVSERVDIINEYNAEQAQVWTVLTAQDFDQSQQPEGIDIPTEPEYMIDAILALQRGVQGLLWFAYGQITPTISGVHLFPDSWNALGRVVQRISQIAPILVGRENEISPIQLSENLDAAFAKKGQQIALLLANHDYFWNGTETEWRLNNETIMFKAENVISVSCVEPEGRIPLNFEINGEYIVFNVSVAGGMILLIESLSPLILSEFLETGILWWSSLLFVTTVLLIRIRKKKRVNSSDL